MSTATASPAKGLSSVPQLSVILSREARTAPKFPRTDLIGAAASMFSNGPQWTGNEGRAFVVTISAGTVGVGFHDAAKRERNALSALGHETRGTTAVYGPDRHTAKDEAGLSYGATFDADGHVVYDDDEPFSMRDGAPARQVEGWSRRSRSRMVRRLAQLDYSPMYAAGRSAAMVTLTYPGDWLTVAPTGKAVKAHLRALWKRWARRWAHDPFVGPWKLEFQRRGAPHLHLLAVLPDDFEFSAWLSATWADVVAHPDPEQRRRHRLAGTGIDYVRGAACFDPKRAAVYFSKHGGAAGGKEYQHNVPKAWQAAGAGPGRFWGYRGLVPVTAEVTVTVGQYVVLRRTLRRWSESKGMSRTRRVPRGWDERTGEQLYRSVTRPVRYVGHGGLAGGTVLLNDGPAFAAKLAALTN